MVYCALLHMHMPQQLRCTVLLPQDKYQPSLEADPTFDAFLSSIEQTYFNIMPASGAGGGLLGGLLKSLLEGDELGGE